MYMWKFNFLNDPELRCTVPSINTVTVLAVHNIIQAFKLIHTCTHTQARARTRTCKLIFKVFSLRGETKDNNFHSNASGYPDLHFQNRILHVQGQQIRIQYHHGHYQSPVRSFEK